MTTLTRPNPLSDMLDWLEHPLGVKGSPAVIRVEDFVRDGAYVVRADIPGVDPDHDIELRILGDVLTIHASRREEKREKGHSEIRYGEFTRSLRLPPDCTSDDIAATYEGGVLEVSVPLATQLETIQVPIRHLKSGDRVSQMPPG